MKCPPAVPGACRRWLTLFERRRLERKPHLQPSPERWSMPRAPRFPRRRDVTNLETNYKNSANPTSRAPTPSPVAGRLVILEAKAAGFPGFRAERSSWPPATSAASMSRLTSPRSPQTWKLPAGATLIETETARIRNSKTFDTLAEVPLNARWIWAFLNLSSNVDFGAGGLPLRRRAPEPDELDGRRNIVQRRHRQQHRRRRATTSNRSRK